MGKYRIKILKKFLAANAWNTSLFLRFSYLTSELAGKIGKEVVSGFRQLKLHPCLFFINGGLEINVESWIEYQELLVKSVDFGIPIKIRDSFAQAHNYDLEVYVDDCLIDDELPLRERKILDSMHLRED